MLIIAETKNMCCIFHVAICNLACVFRKPQPSYIQLASTPRVLSLLRLKSLV